MAISTYGWYRIFRDAKFDKIRANKEHEKLNKEYREVHAFATSIYGAVNTVNMVEIAPESVATFNSAILTVKGSKAPAGYTFVKGNFIDVFKLLIKACSSGKEEAKQLVEEAVTSLEHLLRQGAFVDLVKTHGCYVHIKTRAELEAEAQREAEKQAQIEAIRKEREARKQAKKEGRLKEYNAQRDAEMLKNANKFEKFVWGSKYLFSWWGLLILWGVALKVSWIAVIPIAVVTLCRWAKPAAVINK